MKNSLDTIRHTIQINRLLTKADKVLVAFSGGCDSVCLALALQALGFTIGLAHVHHGLRETADRDAMFCRAFAEKMNVPYHEKRVNAAQIAAEQKISVETAGRQIRYVFFESLLTDYTKIATGHHKNDCAETVLQNLVRGSGLKGLNGILPKRGAVVRPLIDLSRAEIEAFVAEAGVVPCVDETNASAAYARNRIRLQWIPLLEKENKNAVENICRTAKLLQQDEDYLNQTARRYVRENRIEISALKDLHPAIAARALRCAFKYAAGTAKDFEQKHVAYILSHLKDHGEILRLPFSVTCKSAYGVLLFEKETETETEPFCYAVCVGETVCVPSCGKRFTLYVSDKADGNFYFDYAELKNKPLFIRSKQEKDRFLPFGMEGGKTLKKAFIDLKIPVNIRKTQPLLTTDNEILAILGVCRSRLYPKCENTQQYLNIREEHLL